MGSGIIHINTPVGQNQIDRLRVGDRIEIAGSILCGRDAVLPKLAVQDQLEKIEVDLKGSVIFHTAVSAAGIGPTTSNKVEIEGSIPALSRAGVKIHIGKGSLSKETTEALKRYQALFAITPPVSALFMDKMVKARLVAFKEEGMEALYEIEVRGFPAIIAIAHGESIFARS
jgi:fumarate hydratase subunit beta